MNQSLDKLFSEIADEPITEVSLIDENKYCGIYLAKRSVGPAIFKIYKTDDAKLVTLEAEGIRIYHELASTFDNMMDSDVFAFSAEEKIVGITFVPGERFADRLHRVAKVQQQWEPAAMIMKQLGEFLKKMRTNTMLSDEPLDPFHFEYIRYCSKRLNGLPILGKKLFRNAQQEAESLISMIESASFFPSMAHGDFVFRNIHVEDQKVGVIDFANTLKSSHTLNDVFNLWQGLQNMLLPKPMKLLLWEAFQDGMGSHDFSDSEQHFFHEFHRRRWLMLNLKTRDPRRWARVLIANKSFARPWASLESRPLS